MQLDMVRRGPVHSCSVIALEGEDVLQNLAENPTIDLAGFETVVVGSPVYAGRINKRVKRFCSNHESTLLAKRLGLFTLRYGRGGRKYQAIGSLLCPSLGCPCIGEKQFWRAVPLLPNGLVHQKDDQDDEQE